MQDTRNNLYREFFNRIMLHKSIHITGILLFLALLTTVSCQNNDSAIDDEEEEYSGGKAATVFIKSADALGQPLHGLTHEEIRQFQMGNSLNRNNWVAAPSSTTARDGLGPLFNATACASCHVRDGKGNPYNSLNQPTQSLLFRLSVPGKNEQGGPLADPSYGQQFAHQSLLGVQPEGEVSVEFEEIQGTYPDGTAYSLRKPSFTFSNLNYGEMHPEIMVSPRLAPPMAGMGLLDALDEKTILEWADPDDKNNDGISGRPNYVWDVRKQKTVLGKFGWKANEPTAEQQIAGAFSGDMGITSSIFPQENLTPTQARLLAHIPNGGTPELEENALEDVLFYIQTLATPARRNWQDENVKQGKMLFFKAGCESCHRSKMTTSEKAVPQYLAGQTIRPYTDMLLHDMGEELADNRPDFEASGREWRTAPLWSMGLQKTVSKHTYYLHDGRARNAEEAILWHGGEAEKSKQAFMQYNKNERENLLKFLDSL